MRYRGSHAKLGHVLMGSIQSKLFPPSLPLNTGQQSCSPGPPDMD